MLIPLLGTTVIDFKRKPISVNVNVESLPNIHSPIGVPEHLLKSSEIKTNLNPQEGDGIKTKPTEKTNTTKKGKDLDTKVSK